MDVARDTSRRISVADAIRENHAGETVAAGKYCGKIASLVASGGHGDDVAFQTCQLQRAMRSLIPGPQFHAPEGPHRGFRAIKLFGFNLLKLHTNFDA